MESALYPNNSLKVLEILNHPPGETFIQQHAIALNTYAPEIELCWAFTQTNQNGRLPKFDVDTTTGYAWPNYNLYPKWRQALVKAAYAGKSLDALYKPQLKLLKKLKPDLVHFHFSPLAVKYAHLCQQLNIPYTFSLRGSDLHALKSNHPENETYVQQLVAVADGAKAIHAVSEQLKDTFKKLTKSKTNPQIIRTTIDDSWLAVSRNPEPGLLVAIGRLTWQKGFPDLLLAIKNLIHAHPAVKLVIIGEGEQRQELEYMIRDLQLTQHIVLAGKQNQAEIKQWFGKAHAFVLSSIAEGFPNVLAEAMLASVPIVTSNCGGITEIIDNNIHASVYPTSDIAQLTEKLSAVLQTTNHDEQNKRAKKQAVNSFSPQHHATAFKQLWQ